MFQVYFFQFINNVTFITLKSELQKVLAGITFNIDFSN